MDVNALLERQKAMIEERMKTPLEVQVMLGGRVVTVVMPVMQPIKFYDLATSMPAVSAQEVSQFGFPLDATARNYPDVVIRDGEDEDNMLTVAVDGESKEIRYGWPEVYDSLEFDDRQSVRAAIWGEYWFRPSRDKKAATAAGAASKAAVVTDEDGASDES